MVAMQLAKEPLVRQCVRQMFRERAKLQIILTKKGRKEVDESHPIYPYKYLNNKPIRDLGGPQFLHLLNVRPKRFFNKNKVCSCLLHYRKIRIAKYKKLNLITI